MKMVNEEKSEKGKESERPIENQNAGNQSSGSELVERARMQAERLAQENERIEKNIREMRDIEASRLLGGTAGGRVEPQPPKQETAKEYAEKVLSGHFNKK